MTAVILFVFGAIVGSFLNVVALRWDIKNFSGRSKCPSCERTLRWWELVPVVSFLVLGARCSQCKAKISLQYPLIELLTGLIFISVPLFMLPVFCIYIVILIYDFYYKIIPDGLVYTAIVLSLLYSIFFIPYSLSNLLTGPLIFLFFASIWYFSGGRAMGFGDAKLGLSIGWLLGASNGVSAIVLAFWIGAGVSLLLIFLNRQGLPDSVIQAGFLKDAKDLTIKSEVPFAPFMILGAWLTIMYHINVLHFSTIF